MGPATTIEEIELIEANTLQIDFNDGHKSHRVFIAQSEMLGLIAAANKKAEMVEQLETEIQYLEDYIAEDAKGLLSLNKNAEDGTIQEMSLEEAKSQLELRRNELKETKEIGSR